MLLLTPNPAAHGNARAYPRAGVAQALKHLRTRTFRSYQPTASSLNSRGLSAIRVCSIQQLNLVAIHMVFRSEPVLTWGRRMRLVLLLLNA